MNREKYVRKIAHQIKCSNEKKKEISKQLNSDIEERINRGERIEDIICDMGTAQEIAEGFNESISDREKKKYKITKMFKIIISIISVIAIIVIAFQVFIPKSANMESSTYFDKAMVEEKVRGCIELLDEEDYAALRELATEKMQATFQKNIIDDVKAKTTVEWGRRESFGTVYSTELIELGKHYAVCEVTVLYQNINITYRITFDENMKIAGLYMR